MSETVVAPPRERFRWRPFAITGDHWLLLSLLAASLALNVHLYRSRAAPQSEASLPSLRGEAIPPIPVSLPDGTLASVDVKGAVPTVLYVFSESCGWCTRNAPAVASLHSQAQSRFRFVGLSVKPIGGNGSQKADASTPVAFESYFVTYDAASWMRRIGGTPTTLVISPDGVVVQSWPGAYTAKNKTEIEGYFQVKLASINPAAGL
jgi:hypothetical protein